MTKKRKDDDDELERELDEGLERELEQRDEPQPQTQQTEIDPVPAGGNQPATLPPSVVGTEQDPNRKPPEET